MHMTFKLYMLLDIVLKPWKEHRFRIWQTITNFCEVLVKSPRCRKNVFIYSFKKLSLYSTWCFDSYHSLLPTAYKPAIMWAWKKRRARGRWGRVVGGTPLSYRFFLQHSNCRQIGRRSASSWSPIGWPGRVETLQSDGDRGEERRHWLELNWKRKPHYTWNPTRQLSTFRRDSKGNSSFYDQPSSFPRHEIENSSVKVKSPQASETWRMVKRERWPFRVSGWKSTRELSWLWT